MKDLINRSLIATTTGSLTAEFVHHDSASSGESNLRVRLRGHLQLDTPRTMTQEEVRHTFNRLTGLLNARTECHLLVQAAPIEVLPFVLPQLRELIEYEVRMWQAQESHRLPGIQEETRLLPVVV